MSRNFAKTLVWKHGHDVKLWRHKQRTPNTNDHYMTLNQNPPMKIFCVRHWYNATYPETITLRKCPALDMFCINLCGPGTKKFADPFLQQTVLPTLFWLHVRVHWKIFVYLNIIKASNGACRVAGELPTDKMMKSFYSALPWFFNLKISSSLVERPTRIPATTKLTPQQVGILAITQHQLPT